MHWIITQYHLYKMLSSIAQYLRVYGKYYNCPYVERSSESELTKTLMTYLHKHIMGYL